jgi:hypothetical protein
MLHLHTIVLCIWKRNTLSRALVQLTNDVSVGDIKRGVIKNVPTRHLSDQLHEQKGAISRIVT